MKEIFKIATGVSTPIALIGLVVTILFFVFLKIIDKEIYPKLTRYASSTILKMIIEKLFVLSLVITVLGSILVGIDKFIGNKPQSKENLLQYTGQIKDSISLKPIKGVLVTVPTSAAINNKISDKEGKFKLFAKSIETEFKVEVKFIRNGYQEESLKRYFKMHEDVDYIYLKPLSRRDRTHGNVSAQNQNPLTKTPDCIDLLRAADKGNREEVESILNHVGIDCTDNLGQTALYMAAIGAHVDLVNFLLERKANPNIGITARNDYYGWTPLNVANYGYFTNTNEDRRQKYRSVMDSLISEKGWYGNHSIRIRKKNWVFPRRDFEEEATTLVISSDGSLRMRFIAWDDSQRGRFIINGGRLTPKVFELVVGQPFSIVIDSDEIEFTMHSCSAQEGANVSIVKRML